MLQVINKTYYRSPFYKKILFQFVYFKNVMSNLMRNFFVIVKFTTTSCLKTCFYTIFLIDLYWRLI